VNKSSCIRIDRRFKYACAGISTPDGEVIPWVSDIRYLGVDITCSGKLSCSMSKATCKFNSAVNAVIGKLENRVHEEVSIQLIPSKCLPILLCATEVCALNKAQLCSLDLVVVRVAMKLFKSSNRAFDVDCMDQFGLKLPGITISERKLCFASRFLDLNNLFCQSIACKFV
jgi:hypothetical protein